MRKSKRYVHFILFLSIVWSLCSLASIVVCGLLKDNGYGDFWWPLAGLSGFFICSFIAIALLLTIGSDAIFYEIDGKNKKYDAKDLFVFENITEKNIMDAFLSNHFKETDNGYLQKNVSSFARQNVSYYVKITNSNDIKNTVEQEFAFFDSINNERAKNIGFILFLLKRNMDSNDLSQVKEISKPLIIRETIVYSRYCKTAIVVAVDSATNEGYFLDSLNSKISISMYGYCCRLLKRILKVNSRKSYR